MIKSKLSFAFGALKKTVTGGLLAAAMCTTQAQAAAIIDFEDPAFIQNGGLYLAGEAVSVGGFTISTQSKDGGLTGALVDGNDPFTCPVLGCPVNNKSNYFAGLNNSWMYLSRDVGIVRMRSLDYSFIAPLPGYVSGPVGRLLVLALSDLGDLLGVAEQEFAPQVNGEWVFSQFKDIDSTFGGNYFRNYAITACLYTTTGTCALNASNQGQFAVDNISFDVSAPATIGLFSLSLLGLAFRRKFATKL